MREEALHPQGAVRPAGSGWPEHPAGQGEDQGKGDGAVKPDLKKLIITNLPYLLFVWLFGKVGEA